MIARSLAFVGLIYVLGFALYAVSIGRPARDTARPTEAIVVLTGGGGRIEHGLDLLRDRKARRMLIAGADPLVREKDLSSRIADSDRLFACCVDLGSESVDTRTNAEEARRWLEKKGYRSLRLVTDDWHMRRARYEFSRVLGRDYRILSDAVRTEPRLLTLFKEYNKYLLRRVSVGIDA